jgi:hypothetical protein
MAALAHDTPYGYLDGLARSGTHVWFGTDGHWEHQHPDEGGSMYCDVPRATPREAWEALVQRGLLTPELVATEARVYGPDVTAECVTHIHPCGACGGCEEVSRVPGSFPLVFALACNPDGVVVAENALVDLAHALGLPPPRRFVWRAVYEDMDHLDLMLLVRLVGLDREPTRRENMVHLHDEAGFHPEWPDHLGYGSAPRTAVEDATLAYYAGGLDAIADDGTPRHRALRTLLATGYAIPCDLRAAVTTGTLLAAQPFDQRLGDERWWVPPH